MADSQKKIFILEDDESLVQALRDCFERAGFIVHASQHPNEAMDKLREIKFSFIIVDCLLPQTTGVAFITKAQSQQLLGKDTKVIITSGIYTDKDFIQESIHQTKAIGFIKKPINLNEILEIIKKNTISKKSEVSPRKNLYNIFSQQNVSTREKRKLIESLDEVNGFDLPFIYSLLVESKNSGYLNIYNQDGSVSGITLSKGNIISVDIDDQSTILGEMLIQHGYVIADDLKEALLDKSNRRKLGEKLIEDNMMSPHALDIVLREQMNIRLSRTIQDEKIKVNFVSTETELLMPYIDSEMLSQYLHDWIASKVSTTWLKAHYINWMDNYLLISENLKEGDPALKVSLVQNLPNFISRISEKKTIRDLTKYSEYNEKALYKAIHFLLTKGILVFGQKSELATDSEHYSSLKHIWDEISGKKDIEIFEQFLEEAPTFEGHLEDLIGMKPIHSNTEIIELWQKIHDRLKMVFQAMKKTGNKDAAAEKQKQSEIEIKIKANKLIEEARASLQFHRYSEALKLLNQIATLGADVSKFHLFMAWAKLGSLDPAKKSQQLKEIEIELLQVAPDEKYDAVYTFVMGLFYKYKGDASQARKSFEKAIAMDSSMIVAKRELTMLASTAKAGKQDILSMDLKDVINGFFKKK